MSAGKSVRLFLAEGTPGGRTVEIMNWTGHVVAAPRSELAHCSSAQRRLGPASTSSSAKTRTA